jgi:hypothetical protein
VLPLDQAAQLGQGYDNRGAFSADYLRKPTTTDRSNTASARLKAIAQIDFGE